MSTLSSPSPKTGRKEAPSKVTKERLAHILQQEVQECGRVARQLCQQSKSREVLLKAAKKMAGQEGAMENTLANLRQIDQLLEKSLEQTNSIGERMEHTSVLQRQLTDLTGIWAVDT